jgi:hypothetical protein
VLCVLHLLLAIAQWRSALLDKGQRQPAQCRAAEVPNGPHWWRVVLGQKRSTGVVRALCTAGCAHLGEGLLSRSEVCLRCCFAGRPRYRTALLSGRHLSLTFPVGGAMRDKGQRYGASHRCDAGRGAVAGSIRARLAGAASPHGAGPLRFDRPCAKEEHCVKEEHWCRRPDWCARLG